MCLPDAVKTEGGAKATRTYKHEFKDNCMKQGSL